jgi:hypothetical protein
VFERPVKPSNIGRRDFFVIDLDGSGTRKSDVWLYFWGGGESWFTHSYDPQTKSVGYGGYTINRLSPTTFKIRLAATSYWFDSEDRGGYRFRIASFSRTGPGCASGCFDSVPDASWLVHDWTEPELTRFLAPPFSLVPGDVPAVPITWRVIDRGYSGLAGRVLWKRVMGQERWTKVAEGRSSELSKQEVEAEQGQKIQLRVTAWDGARNRMRPRVRETVVPFDDTNAEAGGTFLGLWTEEARPAAYLSGIHVSSTPLDSFQFTAEASMYCVSFQPGEEFGSATFDVDGRTSGIQMTEVYPARTNTHCEYFDTAETRTAVVEVNEGTINIDGYWYE